MRVCVFVTWRKREYEKKGGEAAVWNSMDRYTVTHMKALSIFRRLR